MNTQNALLSLEREENSEAGGGNDNFIGAVRVIGTNSR